MIVVVVVVGGVETRVRFVRDEWSQQVYGSCDSDTARLRLDIVARDVK